MSTIFFRFCQACFLLFLIGWAPALLGQTMDAPGGIVSSSVLDSAPSVTHHSIFIHGKHLSYVARAGYLSIRNEEQTVVGHVFYVSYVLDVAKTERAKRPIMFAWNGGPGSNSGLLQIGGIGPRRIEHSLGPHEAQTLVDNPETWLDFTDLVFVDPIGTGYSYAETPADLERFWSNTGDADSVAEFIRLYLSHYSIEHRPLFILGESYGTFRAAGVAHILLRRNLPLDGIILLSSVLSLQGYGPEKDVALEFPSYCAAALAQHRITASEDAKLSFQMAEVQRWSDSIYLPALKQGAALPTAERKKIADDLSRFTGVDSAIWMQHDLRLSVNDFAEAVTGSHNTAYVGHYDTRMVGKVDPQQPSYDVSKDPSLMNGVDAAIVPYLRNELRFFSDAYYAGPWGGRWPSPDSPRGDWTAMHWKADGNPDLGETVADAVHETSNIRVFMASGYYDFSTPFAASQYAVNQMKLTPAERRRIQLKSYASGHEIYMTNQARLELRLDAKEFLAGTSRISSAPGSH